MCNHCLRFLSLNRWTQARTPCVLVEPLPLSNQEPSVGQHTAPFCEAWRGQRTVLLSIPMTVKVTGTIPWVHRPRVKEVEADWTVIPDYFSMSARRQPCWCHTREAGTSTHGRRNWETSAAERYQDSWTAGQCYHWVVQPVKAGPIGPLGNRSGSIDRSS